MKKYHDPVDPIEDFHKGFLQRDYNSHHTYIFCHYCGYVVPKVPSDGKCPECGRCAWEFDTLGTMSSPLDME